MTEIKIEMGKLMGQFDILNQTINELKKGMEKTNREMQKLHNDFLTFSVSVMTEMEKRFVKKDELALLKRAVSVVVVTLFTALCLSGVDVAITKWFNG